MPSITNQEMRRALTIVLDLARQGVVSEDDLIPIHRPQGTYDPVATRNKQLKAIELVEHLQTTLFMHSLTRVRE